MSTSKAKMDGVWSKIKAKTLGVLKRRDPKKSKEKVKFATEKKNVRSSDFLTYFIIHRFQMALPHLFPPK